MPSFADLYGAEPEIRAGAPGRVNLIGEHTDYNGGYVLPAAIPQRTVVELRRSAGRTVEAWSRELGGGDGPRRYVLGEEAPGGGWLDFVQGITHALGGDGHALGGFQVRIESSIPVGSGLSSSAALEIALLRALREAFGLPLDDIGLARLGQRVENDFVGAPVGIMDQMACSLAGEGHALFIDTRTLRHERIALPDTARLVVIDSGVPHSHASGEYRTRRAECERAAAALGVRELRDAGPADLARAGTLPDPLGRRARHVVTENARVLEAVAALRAGDAASLGALFSASHASQRDDFDVSVPEIDLLVAIAAARPDVYGARLTGGGFGGAVVALVEPGRAEEIAARVAAEYSRRSGRSGTVLLPGS